MFGLAAKNTSYRMMKKVENTTYEKNNTDFTIAWFCYYCGC